MAAFKKNLLYFTKSHTYILLGLLIILSYLIVNALSLENNIIFIEGVMLSLIIVVTILFKIFYHKKPFNGNEILIYIILLGLIMRIGYMLYTPCTVRSHDFGNFNMNLSGHDAYLLTIIKENHLPLSNENQYYHQPFYYIVSSIFSIIINKILGRTADFYLVDAAKVVSCFASCAVIIIASKICDAVEMKKKYKIVTMCIVSFLPNFYLLAGRVNNDSLVIFFMTCAILYTIYWLKNQSWKNTILLALIYGFGMMTKVSIGVYALFTGVVMINVLTMKFQEKSFKDLLLKFGVFGLISFPLGLWYAIRNHIMFNQSISYVPKLSETSDIYCGNYSFFQRFVFPSISNLLSSPYAHPFEDYNYPAYLIKTSVFGEFTFNQQGFIPTLLLFTNLMLVILSVIAFIYIIFFSNRNDEIRYILTGLWILVYISSIKFNLSYPFGCTMDFRYIVPTAILGAIFIGAVYEELMEKSFESQSLLSTFKEFYINTTKASVILFSIFSILMYCTITI